jgi:hypothetical protein
MKNSFPFALLAAAVLTTLSGTAHAQVLTPIATTGYNLDPFFSTTPGDTTGSNGTFQSFNFVVANWYYNGSGGTPLNGTIVSSGNPNATFQLQPYDQNNVLTLLNANGTPNNLPVTGTLTLTTPQVYTHLSFILTDAGSGGVTATFNFAGGKTATETIGSLPYWVGGDPTPSGGVVATNALQIYQNTNVNLDEYDFAVPQADIYKQLDSVTFTYTGVNGQGGPSGALGIFALSGTVGQAPEPSTWAMMIGGIGALFLIGRMRRKQNV